MRYVSVIIKLKLLNDDYTQEDALENLRLAAIECQEVFGRGGNPNAPIIEEFLGKTNTPCSRKHVRSEIEDTFGQGLEYEQSSPTSKYIEVVTVEWEGQEMFQTGVDGDGNPEYLCVIGSLPMKPESLIEEEI